MDIERPAEYAMDACQDLFYIDRQSWFDIYTPRDHIYENMENENKKSGSRTWKSNMR